MEKKNLEIGKVVKLGAKGNVQQDRPAATEQGSERNIQGQGSEASKEHVKQQALGIGKYDLQAEAAAIKEGEQEMTKDELKLSYEELEKVAQQLNGRCMQLEQQLMRAGDVIKNFNDVEMLLDIVKAGDVWFDDHFIRRCAYRIETVVGRLLDAVELREEEEETRKKAGEGQG